MPLFIGRQLITDQSDDAILQHILALPQPVVQPRSARISPKQVCLASQREILIGTKKALQANNIHYLGTKKLVSCLALYIESDHEYVLAHVDNCRQLSTALTTIFSQLTATDAIRIKILGGEENDQNSRDSLGEILGILKTLAANPANHLTITHHLLWPVNLATSEDIDYYLLDRFIRKIALFYRLLFAEDFDFSYLDHLDISDFNKVFLYNSLPGWYQSQKKPTAAFPLDYFIGCLNQIRPITNAKKLETLHQFIIPHLFPSDLPKAQRKSYFLALATAIFCQEGKGLMLRAYQEILQTVHLSHFVFSLDSGQITPIPLHFSFTQENYRQTVLLDTIASPSYHIRNVTDTRLIPLSAVFLQKCQTIEATVLRQVSDQQDFDKNISRLFHIPEKVTLIDDLCEFIQSPDYALAQWLANPKTITDQYRQGVQAFRANRFNEALALLQPTLVAYLALHGPASTAVGIGYSTLSSCYRELGLLDAALLAAETGLKALYQCAAMDKLTDLLNKYLLIIDRASLTAEKLHSKAIHFFKDGNLTVATALCHLASKKCLAANQLDKVATCLSLLASCYRDQGRLTEALEAAKQFLELRQQLFPATSAEVQKAQEKYEALLQSQPQSIAVNKLV